MAAEWQNWFGAPTSLACIQYFGETGIDVQPDGSEVLNGLPRRIEQVRYFNLHPYAGTVFLAGATGQTRTFAINANTPTFTVTSVPTGQQVDPNSCSGRVEWQGS